MNTIQQDMIGKQFGQWAVLSIGPRIGVGNRTRPTVVCRCACGRQSTVRVNDICYGKSTRCGRCQRMVNVNKRKKDRTHKLLVRCWLDMRSRCSNPKNISYKNYGGRGIEVCKDWELFDSFKSWAMLHGFQIGLTIERVDVNAGYSPSNCCWIPKSQQAKNTRPRKKGTRGRFVKNAVLLLCALLTFACASTKPRTKFTDPSMRLMVDPDGISARDYIRVVSALKASGKWFVVDRRDGLRAIFKEQKMIHRTYPDKFKDEEKYSIWGRLYGVGGVVIAHADCYRRPGFWSVSSVCRQTLAIVSANSGEVVATADMENDDAELNYSGDIKIGSDWTDAVSELNKNFPEEYEKLKYSDDMRLFRQEAKEEAIRQKTETVQPAVNFID